MGAGAVVEQCCSGSDKRMLSQVMLNSAHDNSNSYPLLCSRIFKRADCLPDGYNNILVDVFAGSSVWRTMQEFLV